MKNTSTTGRIIGILALQGDFDAHQKTLQEKLGVTTRMVRTPRELEGVEALVLPGGESTTIAKLMDRIGLAEAIQKRAKAGMPILGTCAGMILLAREIEGRPDQPTLKLMDIEVARNAFGRQRESFEADIPLELGAGMETTVRGVFIRAPYVLSSGPDVEILSHFQDKIVGVRQGALLATAFHPELTEDTRLHRYFVEMVDASVEKSENKRISF